MRVYNADYSKKNHPMSATESSRRNVIKTDDIRSLVMQRKDGNTIRRAAIQGGMITFREHGIQKVLSGITTIEELLSNTQLDL